MTTAAPPQRRLVTGGSPDAAFAIPPGETFFDGEHNTWLDFLPDDRLEEIGRALISEKLTHLDDGEFTVHFRWKRRGGTSKGHAMLGNCVKLAGPARHYAPGVHMLIYLAADHLEVEGYSNWQVEALIYHELLKVDREERTKIEKIRNADGTVTKEEVDLPTIYRVLMPDFSGFYQEIAEYGLWHEPLARLGEVIQPALPGFGAP